MKTMLKRNDGYALGYVLVVLLVLAAVALAVMTLSLNALKRQQSTIDHMVDKYAAQGYVEQLVAQFEHAKTADEIVDICNTYDINNDPNCNPYCTTLEIGEGKTVYTVIGLSGRAKVTAELTLEPIPVNEEGSPEPVIEGEENTPSTTEVYAGYTVTYLSYKTEIIPDAEVTE